MDVSTLCTDYFTEHALLCHVQSIHLEPVIAAVLQNHTMFAGLFAQVNQFPTLFQVHCRRHFNSHVLAILQGTLCHGEVVHPVGSHIYQVDIIALAKFFITFLARIDGGFGERGLLQIALAGFRPFLFVVAQGNNLRARDVCETFHSTGTAHSQADKTYTDHFHLGQRQSQHALLSRRTDRRIDYDCPFLPFPLRTFVVGMHGRLY